MCGGGEVGSRNEWRGARTEGCEPHSPPPPSTPTKALCNASQNKCSFKKYEFRPQLNKNAAAEAEADAAVAAAAAAASSFSFTSFTTIADTHAVCDGGVGGVGEEGGGKSGDGESRACGDGNGCEGSSGGENGCDSDEDSVVEIEPFPRRSKRPKGGPTTEWRGVGEDATVQGYHWLINALRFEPLW